MTLVVDSSVVLALLTDQGPEGEWAALQLASGSVSAPRHLYAEVAAVLRRRTLGGHISDEAPSLAYASLLAMDFDLHDYEPYAYRIWQLRHTVTIKDAWFVALAEAMDVPLATLDGRLTRAPGPPCQFLTPPTSP